MTPESLSLIGAAVTVVGVTMTAAMTFMRTRGSVTSEVIKNFETLDKQNKEQILDWRNRTLKCEDLHRENLEKVGNLQGQLDTTLAILKDRNPETTKFMEYLTAVASRSDAFMENSGKREDKILNALTEIGSFMKSINEHMKGPNTTVNVSTPSLS